MSFVVDGEHYTIKGDPSLGSSQITLKAMVRTLHKEGRGLWLEFTQMEEGRTVSEGKQEVSGL